MKKAITITIPEPCHENWDQMTPTEKGKFCGVCTKEVVDFSKSSDEELIKKVGKSENLCGRFNASQLNRKLTLERKSKNNLLPYAASLLVPLGLLGGPDAHAQGGPIYTETQFTSLGIGTNPLKSIVTITGFISDENNIPINNAEVFVLETGKSVRTGPDGSYKIVCTSGSTIFAIKGEITSDYVLLGTKNEKIDLKLKPVSELKRSVISVVGRIVSSHTTVEEVKPNNNEQIDEETIEGEIEIEEIPEIENEEFDEVEEKTVVEQLNTTAVSCGLTSEVVLIKGRQKISAVTEKITVNETISEEKPAPNIIISGTITDENDLPLPGVNVIIKNTKIGTQTDFHGNYAISPEANQTLVFQYLGYETKEITVSNVSNTIGFQMQPMYEGMVSVVVGGFNYEEVDTEVPAVNNPFDYNFPRNDDERAERVKRRRKAKANEMAFKKIKLEKKKLTKATNKRKRKRK